MRKLIAWYILWACYSTSKFMKSCIFPHIISYIKSLENSYQQRWLKNPRRSNFCTTDTPNKKFQSRCKHSFGSPYYFSLFIICLLLLVFGALHVKGTMGVDWTQLPNVAVSISSLVIVVFICVSFYGNLFTKSSNQSNVNFIYMRKEYYTHICIFS